MNHHPNHTWRTPPVHSPKPKRVKAGPHDSMLLVITIAAAVTWVYAGILIWDAFRYQP